MSAITKLSNLSNTTEQTEKEREVGDETDGNEISAALQSLKKLMFLKILVLDIGISLGDVATDILQGLSLIFNDTWGVSDTCSFGIIVLMTCWLPGPVALLHLVITKYHQFVRHQNLAYLLFLGVVFLICFPIVPPLLYLVVLLNKTRQASAREVVAYTEFHQLADELKAMTGVLESPMQIVVMGLLMLKGVLIFPWNREVSSSCIEDELGRRVSGLTRLNSQL